MTTPRHVVVIGAGVAGLSAAVALASDGASVTLLERRPFPGGRAYSYPHPALNETIDSQHVILGCCTNFIDLITQSSAAQTLRWYDTLTFLEPNRTQTRVPHVRDSSTVSTMGLQSTIQPTKLPAPFHNTLSFLRAPMLSLRDKAAIASGLAHFLRTIPADDTESFASWLRRTHQTDRAIRHFWEPIILGALNDTFDRCSLKYAAKVFHESFLRSPQAGSLGIPTAPLSEFFAPVLAHARTLGVDVRLNTPADAISPLPNNRWRITSGSTTIEADALILAINLRETHRLLSGCPIHAASSHEWVPLNPAHFITAPITTIHLWYDREITTLDHAVLLDTRIQWIFNKSRIRRHDPALGSYLELVISASHAELSLSREQILASALAELELFFPAVRNATLLKSAVLKEARATFSVTPGLDAHRPTSTTAHPNLYLAGDYTATDWPSTMESAVRSGRLAAAAALATSPGRFLAPELPATGLMRLLARLHKPK
jgi:squalene-associated FAD-dependent desaturase